MLVTGGQCGDSPQFTAVLDGIRIARPGGPDRTRPQRVLADKAYSSRANRGYLRRRGIQATIAEPADQTAHRRRRGSRGGRPPTFDTEAYKQRHAVEVGINRLKRHRSMATRYAFKAAASGRMAGLGAPCRFAPGAPARPEATNSEHHETQHAPTCGGRWGSVPFVATPPGRDPSRSLCLMAQTSAESIG